MRSAAQSTSVPVPPVSSTMNVSCDCNCCATCGGISQCDTRSADSSLIPCTLSCSNGLRILTSPAVTPLRVTASSAQYDPVANDRTTRLSPAATVAAVYVVPGPVAETPIVSIASPIRHRRSLLEIGHMTDERGKPCNILVKITACWQRLHASLDIRQQVRHECLELRLRSLRPASNTRNSLRNEGLLPILQCHARDARRPLILRRDHILRPCRLLPCSHLSWRNGNGLNALLNPLRRATKILRPLSGDLIRSWRSHHQPSFLRTIEATYRS